MGDTGLVPSKYLRETSRDLLEIMDVVHQNTVATRECDNVDASVWASIASITDALDNIPGFRKRLGVPDGLTHMQHSIFATGLCSVACWRHTQAVYQFDQTLREELQNTPATDVPADVVKRLPYPCVWIQMDDDGGFFVMLDDTRAGIEVVLLGLHRSIGQVFKLVVTASLGVLGQATKLVEGSGYDPGETGIPLSKAIQVNATMLGSLMSMVLYLCSEEPDITSKPSPMNQARIRRGKTPYHPTIHHVGYRIGAAFRKAKAEREASQGTGGHGASPAPHMRRAHWHTYWVGKENTPQRRQVVKWLPPIPVNVKSDDDIIPTIHKVKR